MANVSVSSLILFIASMTLAVGVAGTLVTNVSQISDSIDQRSVGISETIETEIVVISDSGSDAIYDDAAGEVTLLVKNTGATTLSNDSGDVVVLLDGQYVESGSLTVTVLEETSWRPGTVVRIVVSRSLEAGDHRVVVEVNEDREVFEFHI